MSSVAADDPGARADRPGFWDGWRRLTTSGVASGTEGERLNVLRGYLAIAAFMLLIDTVNVLSTLQDAARIGRSLPAWLPIEGELTSWVGQLVACGIVYRAMRVAPPGQAGLKRFALVHALASVFFSSAHCVVMYSLRAVSQIVAKGSLHLLMFSDIIYEFRKDVLAYLLFLGIFWIVCRSRQAAVTTDRNYEPPPRDATFDLVNGATTCRVRVQEILAARAAGNYVEFLLEDGRRPLMRISLEEVEGRLSPQGFLRTHRSWLINPAQLKSFHAIGSGDYRLDFGGGTQALLSRRFPDALDCIRGSEKTGYAVVKSRLAGATTGSPQL